MSENQVIRRVAVVLFDGFTVLDAYGPIQAFGASRRNNPDGTRLPFYDVITLGMRSGPARSGEGPSTEVSHTLTDAPPWDVLLVPGGPGTRKLVDDKAFIAWLRQASERSPI